MINLQVSITAAYLRSNSLNTVVHTLVVQSINVANEKFIVAPVNWGGISITRNIFANVENADGNALHRSNRGDAGHSLVHHVALRCGGVEVAAVVITLAGLHAVEALFSSNFCFKGAGITTEYQNIILTPDGVSAVKSSWVMIGNIV